MVKSNTITIEVEPKVQPLNIVSVMLTPENVKIKAGESATLNVTVYFNRVPNTEDVNNYDAHIFLYVNGSIVEDYYGKLNTVNPITYFIQHRFDKPGKYTAQVDVRLESKTTTPPGAI